MRYSGIGGQAVMEGVMMKNQETYAVAVRRPDQEIIVEASEYQGIIRNQKIRNFPILRGVFSFIESLTLGMRTLTFSASFCEEEPEKPSRAGNDQKEEPSQAGNGKEAEAGNDQPAGAGNGEPSKAGNDQPAGAGNGEPSKAGNVRNADEPAKAGNGKAESLAMGGTVALSIVLAVGIFMVLPYGISLLFQRFVTSRLLIALLEGVIRLAIFIGYVAVISLMPDIRRVYMYHGAEHKCINCIENGMDLTVENVKKSSRYHKRCGTSFLLIVMLISIVFFMLIRVDHAVGRLVLRILLIPVIAGVSYEFIRAAGRSDNPVIHVLSMPGMWLQRVTTREPDESMIEVGIASVEAVFDWHSYVEEIRQERREEL